MDSASARPFCALGEVGLGGATPAGKAFDPRVQAGSFIKMGLSAAYLLVLLRNKTDI